MIKLQFSKILRQLSMLVFATVVFAGHVYAQTPAPTPTVTSLTASDMLANIVAQLPALTKMVTAIAYVMGMGFIIAALMKLKLYGEARTMMSQQHHLSQPVAFLVVGAFLMYLPSAINTTMSTFWTNPNPYGYLNEAAPWWTTSINDVIMVIQFFGLIAFIRGLVIVSHLGGHHGGQGGLGKGLTHIIGGIFCINIYQFVQLILFTLGLQIS